ncbi:protein LURP-one-related 4-like [Arachis hypogaea]|nr:protein LURP-one-related 4-like [Arachis hypogaea]
MGQMKTRKTVFTILYDIKKDIISPMTDVIPMAKKVYPAAEASCSGKYTVWMKSLVFHSNGCTVYDSNGDIVYRVDNYDKKGATQVNLMDLRGTLVCSIHKKLLAFGRWDVYRCNDSDSDYTRQQQKTKKKPWFEVKTSYKMMITGRVARCQVTTIGCQKYCIHRICSKTSGFMIFNMKNGHIVANAKQKQTCSGILLGKDVLRLDVEGDIDHSLIMAFVTVFALVCGSI